MTEPLTKLIIINNHHLSDYVIHYNYNGLRKLLEGKGFKLTQHFENPCISIFENSEIKLNEKLTHVHFDLSGTVREIKLYISELK